MEKRGTLAKNPKRKAERSILRGSLAATGQYRPRVRHPPGGNLKDKEEDSAKKNLKTNGNGGTRERLLIQRNR